MYCYEYHINSQIKIWEKTGEQKEDKKLKGNGPVQTYGYVYRFGRPINGDIQKQESWTTTSFAQIF